MVVTGNMCSSRFVLNLSLLNKRPQLAFGGVIILGMGGPCLAVEFHGRVSCCSLLSGWEHPEGFPAFRV